ncbi:MAG TPA: LacI family DNA-binding transcriptional regulator [Pseudorhizobium sp.]|nr:LacI family DNA-binding transcriptional regulator [Pseudorhizobium sp.]
MHQRRARTERVTLQDVATALGISSITVSRAIREPEKVSEPLRERVLHQVEQMGYVPDLAARALASRHSGVIGVLAPALTSHAHLSIMRGIEERVRTSDLRIQYANSRYDPEEECRQIRLFLSQHPAGILLSGLQHRDGALDLLDKAPCPVVQIVDLHLMPSGIAVGVNHCDAAASAIRHLLACGYRRIGLIGGTRDVRSERRQEGYRLAMQDAGLADCALVVSEDAPTSVQLGCQLLQRLRAQAPDLDCVFCQNDDLALGVLFEAQRLGLAIPDFGICGYNDLGFAGYSHPALTTVRVPRFEMGYRAIDLLIRAVEGERLPAAPIDLGFELIPRGTTRRPA